MNVTLRVKEHFDQVAALWQSREAKNWQARLACEAIAMTLLGLDRDNPPGNSCYVNDAVMDLVFAPANPLQNGAFPDANAGREWLKKCRQALQKTIRTNSKDIKYRFPKTPPKVDMGEIAALMTKAQRLVHEANNPVEPSGLAELAGSYRLSPAYQNCFKSIRDKFIGGLNKAGDLPAMAQLWPDFNENEKIHWLRKQVQALARIQTRQSGIYIPPTRLEWRSNLKVFGQAAVDMSKNNGENDVLLINRDNKGIKTSLSAALDCAIHEQYHQLHNFLARAKRSGLIDETHPLYEDAVYFDALWARDGYITIGEAYKVQPDERYAIGFSDSVAIHVNGVLKDAETHNRKPASAAIHAKGSAMSLGNE